MHQALEQNHLHVWVPALLAWPSLGDSSPESGKGFEIDILYPRPLDENDERLKYGYEVITLPSLIKDRDALLWLEWHEQQTLTKRWMHFRGRICYGR